MGLYSIIISTIVLYQILDLLKDKKDHPVKRMTKK